MPYSGRMNRFKDNETFIYFVNRWSTLYDLKMAVSEKDVQQGISRLPEQYVFDPMCHLWMHPFTLTQLRKEYMEKLGGYYQ